MRSTTVKWPQSIDEAKKTQKRLAGEVSIIPLKKDPSLIAGIDAAFKTDIIIAAVCLFEYPTLRLIERSYTTRRVTFPYVPGYLSFREGPTIIDALNRLKENPDLIILDGQGIAHPLRFGLASHIGVLLDVPSIGCAKSRLIGDYREPGLKKGCRSVLSHKGKQVGIVLRTRKNVTPLFISPGHRIDFSDSVRIVLNCAQKYRLPEPTRCADQFSKEAKKEFLRSH